MNIIVRGSYGNLTVHALSGLIVHRDCGDETDYDDIVWFDPKRLPRYAWNECDILDAAFVTNKGSYVRELGHNGQEWVDQLLLEGPKS